MDGLDSIQDIVSTSLGELPIANLLKNHARKDICNHYPRNYTGLSFLAVSTANRQVFIWGQMLTRFMVIRRGLDLCLCMAMFVDSHFKPGLFSLSSCINTKIWKQRVALLVEVIYKCI